VKRRIQIGKQKKQKNVATLYMEDYEKMKNKIKHSEQQQQRQQQ
jgi:hypothetical protein